MNILSVFGGRADSELPTAGNTHGIIIISKLCVQHVLAFIGIDKSITSS